MSDERAKITGIVLAGGRGRRMGGVDKGLMEYRGRPMVEYALDALGGVAGTVIINANRNLEEYARYGVPVVTDLNECFEGPLSGLLAAMKYAQTQYVLTVPCDSPKIDEIVLLRLAKGLIIGDGTRVCCAHDGKSLQPVFTMADRHLAEDLEVYLKSGQRKVETWLCSHRAIFVDFSDCPEKFANANTLDELLRLAH